MIKRLLFFIIPFLFTINVYALDVNVTSSITSPNDPTQGRYSGTEIYNTGTDNVYQVGTRYNGKLSRIRFNLPLPSDLGQCFSTGVTYTVTLNMATSDWRNKFGEVSASAYNRNFALGGVPTYVSMKKIYFNVKLPTSIDYCVDYLFVDIQSTNVSTTAFTGESNWNLSSIILTDPTYTSSPSSTPTPTPVATPDFGAIISNQNQNTQDIIDNQNQNTNDIISSNVDNTNNIIENANDNTAEIVTGLTDISQHVLDSSTSIITNQNQNTQNIVDNINMCTILDSSKATFRGTIYDTGQFASLTTGATYASDYIDISGYNLVVVSKATSGDNRACFYSSTSWQSKISCFVSSSISVGDSISIPDNAKYLRYISRPSENAPSYKLCKNGFSAISSGIDNVNDTMKDDNIDDNTSFFSDFETNNHGLTGIITAPLTTIQGLVNNTCSPLEVPIPFTNSNVSLPCMNEVYRDVLGGYLYSIIQSVITGIISYFICLDIFRIVKGFKDPTEDKIEVLDL